MIIYNYYLLLCMLFQSLCFFISFVELSVNILNTMHVYFPCLNTSFLLFLYIYFASIFHCIIFIMDNTSPNIDLLDFMMEHVELCMI